MNEAPATIQRSYRIRVYPNAAQRARLARWFGAARWAWNHALERRSKAYRRRGESVTGTDVSRAITALKRTRRYVWLNEIPSSVVVQKLRDQDRAFSNFFAGRARYPRFRKRANAQSVRLQLDQRQVARQRRWEAGAVAIPGLGGLKYRGGRHPQQYPKMATVRRRRGGPLLRHGDGRGDAANADGGRAHRGHRSGPERPGGAVERRSHRQPAPSAAQAAPPQA